MCVFVKMLADKRTKKKKYEVCEKDENQLDSHLIQSPLIFKTNHDDDNDSEETKKCTHNGDVHSRLLPHTNPHDTTTTKIGC